MSSDDDPAAIEAELERIRAERDALAERVAALEEPRHGRIRSLVVGALVVVVCLAMLGSVVGVWARRSALNEDVFDKRVAPLGADPRIKEALAVFITNEVMVTIDPENIFREALPDRATILAVPLAGAVEGFVHDQVRSFLDTDEFERLWASATTTAHTAAVRLVEGKSDVVGTDGDTLVINLIPVINGVLARIGNLSPDLFGHTIDLPTLTADDLPQDAIEELGDALGVTLPDEFGVIRITEAGGALAAAQDGVRIFNYAVFGLIAITIIALALALWISRRRRRTLLQIVGGLAITFMLFRRIGWRLEDDALDLVKSETNRDAAEAVLSTFVDPLFSAVSTILWILVAIGAVALVTGPYDWAVRLRSVVAQLAASAVAAAGAVSARAGRADTIEWVQRNLSALQAAGGVVAFVLLVLLNLSWGWLLFLLLLVGLYELALWRIGHRQLETLTGDAPPPPAPPPEPTAVNR